MNNVKSIIVTGSSSGLGASICRQSSKDYDYYFGASRFNGVDVGKYEDVLMFFDGIRQTLIQNEIHVPYALINNAGICKQGSIIEMDVKDWDEQIKVNLNGVFYACKEYIKLCKEFNFAGKIINIASTAGTGSRPGRACYAASKAAVINFSLSLADELKQDGFKVYCICPGAFDSKLRREIAPDDDFDSMLKPHEIANFIMGIIENGKFLDNQIIYTRR